MAQLLRFAPLRERRSLSSRPDRLAFALIVHDLRFLARNSPAALDCVAQFVHGFVVHLQAQQHKDNPS